MPYVQLDGHAWHYQTWGNQNLPSVLLLHGFTGSSQSWRRLAKQLCQEYFVIAPDLPGHGLTEIPEPWQQLTMNVTASRLVRLLDHLSIHKAAVLGYSMGGRLALHVASQHGERLTSLILESASPGLVSAEERALRRQRDAQLADAIEAKGLSWFIDYWADLPLFRTQSDAVRADENRIRQSQRPHGLAHSLRGAGTGQQSPLWDTLKSLRMPVLLLTGSLDAKFTQVADKMSQHLAHPTWVTISEAGHTVHAEQPEAYYRHVQDFLTTIQLSS